MSHHGAEPAPKRQRVAQATQAQASPSDNNTIEVAYKSIVEYDLAAIGTPSFAFEAVTVFLKVCAHVFSVAETPGTEITDAAKQKVKLEGLLRPEAIMMLNYVLHKENQLVSNVSEDMYQKLAPIYDASSRRELATLFQSYQENDPVPLLLTWFDQSQQAGHGYAVILYKEFLLYIDSNPQILNNLGTICYKLKEKISISKLEQIYRRKQRPEECKVMLQSLVQGNFDCRIQDVNQQRVGNCSWYNYSRAFFWCQAIITAVKTYHFMDFETLCRTGYLKHQRFFCNHNLLISSSKCKDFTLTCYCP